ncbi:MAG TPA: aspartyl protease family protein [Phycisphaerae bacterium]|nr:aspartyl protease family protein [Phycisphaerae bacterium]
MYRRGRYIVTALAALVVLLGGQSRQEPVAESRPATEHKTAAIPFELSSNKPFVQVRVNDSDPLWFIFDTGAGGCCVARKRADLMGLELEGEKQVHTGAGEGALVSIATTKGVTFSVGGVKAVNQAPTVVSLDHVAAYEGRAVDGLLGHSFIRRFAVEIDYANRTIHLHDPNTYAYSGPGRAIPIKFLGHLVVVRASITVPGRDPIAGDFVVDTGSRLALVLNRPFVEENKLVEAMPKTLAATIGGGAGGECKGYAGRLESMQLGPFLIRQPVVTLSQDRTGVLASPSFAGIIGGPILRRCRVFFDYQHAQLILEPYARVPAPYEYDMSGTFLIAESPDFKRLKVQSVAEDSPAAEAGLHRGDVITAIDGRPAAEFTLEQVRQLFKKPGRECRLDVHRGDEHFRTKLRLRRLI